MSNSPAVFDGLFASGSLGEYWIDTAKKLWAERNGAEFSMSDPVCYFEFHNHQRVQIMALETVGVVLERADRGGACNEFLVAYYWEGQRRTEWMRPFELADEPKKVRSVIAPPSEAAATADESLCPAPAGVSEAGAIELLRRALPFLHDAAKPYEDDGANEPLELAREIEGLFEARAAVGGVL